MTQAGFGERALKLYYHPLTTTSRPIMLYLGETGTRIDLQVIDILTGEHYQPGYRAINPNQLVSTLDDDGFLLTESSAILKYLADKSGSALYPKDLRVRARVNERMDWVSTQLCRDLCYDVVYPHIFPNHKR